MGTAHLLTGTANTVVLIPHHYHACCSRDGRRLEWLGHLARFDDTGVRKQLLFACLPQSRPFCGPRRRWKVTIHTDLSVAGVRNWLELASDRGEWRGVVTAAGEDKEPAPKNIECPTCNRLFRRSSDMARHKCSTIRQLPVSEQPRSSGVSRIWLRGGCGRDQGGMGWG